MTHPTPRTLAEPPCRSRRALLRAIRDATLLAALPASGALRAEEQAHSLAALEAAAGGRLGVAALDTGSGRTLSHRGDERFGMCSTFKLALAAVILRECDRGRLSLEQRVVYGPGDMVPYAPVTSVHLARGWMTVGALAEATQTTSDNVAANLLLGLIGGPEGFTAKLREAGDEVTRLDRLEPAMNRVPEGEIRDTTTPLAYARTVAGFVAGDGLDAASQRRLVDWTVATRTGTRRLRAGLPSDWRAGDKTGTGMAPGMPDKYNDVAIAFPPGRAPLVIAAYYESPRRSEEIRAEDEAVLASAARIVVEWLGAAG